MFIKLDLKWQSIKQSFRYLFLLLIYSSIMGKPLLNEYTFISKLLIDEYLFIMSLLIIYDLIKFKGVCRYQKKF